MSRPVRIEYPGATYHVTSRGKDERVLFEDVEDRGVFLNTLATVVERFDWLLHSYVLMDNHYHLVVEVPDANLSRGMRQLNGLYTLHVNRRYDKTGSVFNGRFKSVLLEKKNYLLPVCRHVVTNPARVQPSQSISSYRWSSYPSLAGMSPLPPFLHADAVLKHFSSAKSKKGAKPAKFSKLAHQKYRDYVKEGMTAPSPLQGRTNQVLLGSPGFLKEMKPALQGQDPRWQAGKAGRKAPKAVRRKPSLKTMFRKVDNKTRQQRNELMRRAHMDYNYTLMEIGDHLGLHYTTVSKVVNS